MTESEKALFILEHYGLGYSPEEFLHAVSVVRQELKKAKALDEVVKYLTDIINRKKIEDCNDVEFTEHTTAYCALNVIEDELE